MGSSHGIKLKSIPLNSSLSQLLFDNNSNHIIPYIYFITKINHIYLQGILSKDTIVTHITISNIFTKKEYNIPIAPIGIEALLSEVQYSFEKCPILNSVLLISNVIKNSYSDNGGIVKERMILLGNEEKYFTVFEQVEEEVNKGNLKFLFYDYCNDNVFEVDFGLYKEKDETFKMGFECKFLPMSDFINNYIENKAIELLKNTPMPTKERITISTINTTNETDIINTTTSIIEENNKFNTNDYITKNEIKLMSNNDNKENKHINNRKSKLIPRDKYSKHLNIYSKIDSNYNYINTSNDLKYQIGNNTNLNLNPDSNTNTNTILLIKSLQLPSSLSIEDLYMNAYLIRKPN